MPVISETSNDTYSHETCGACGWDGVLQERAWCGRRNKGAKGLRLTEGLMASAEVRKVWGMARQRRDLVCARAGTGRPVCALLCRAESRSFVRVLRDVAATAGLSGSGSRRSGGGPRPQGPRLRGHWGWRRVSCSSEWLAGAPPALALALGGRASGLRGMYNVKKKTCKTLKCPACPVH
eukprot:scaffold31504_cov129-Isochrysis_galbana.AAC.1